MLLKLRPKILVIGLLPDESRSAWTQLEERGFVVEREPEVGQGLERARSEAFDLLVLDARGASEAAELQKLLGEVAGERSPANAHTPLVLVSEALPESVLASALRIRISAVIDGSCAPGRIVTKVRAHCRAQPVRRAA